MRERNRWKEVKVNNKCEVMYFNFIFTPFTVKYYFPLATEELLRLKVGNQLIIIPKSFPCNNVNIFTRNVSQKKKKIQRERERERYSREWKGGRNLYGKRKRGK